jgi:peptide-methionine (S)-S-oxide reductase
MRKVALILALASISGAAPAAPKTETAVLAGGCFWGVEAVFEHVKGVTNVVSGFAGGSRADASYDKVSSETTGHAEAVKISYNPSQVSYAQLLQIFFTVAHDPTQVNRQGPDKGPSYRSAIFPQSRAQERFARAFIAKLEGAHIFNHPIATKIEHGAFFPAEEFHQNFYDKHPDYPYIVINDKPKVAALQQRFPKLWKS